MLLIDKPVNLCLKIQNALKPDKTQVKSANVASTTSGCLMNDFKLSKPNNRELKFERN